MGKHKMVCHRRTGKYVARLALALGVLQFVAVLGSWIFKAVNPELPIRSLLSADGIRWMVGNFGDNLGQYGLWFGAVLRHSRCAAQAESHVFLGPFRADGGLGRAFGDCGVDAFAHSFAPRRFAWGNGKPISQ